VWQRVDTRPTPCLNLELVCEVPNLQDTGSNHHRHMNGLSAVVANGKIKSGDDAGDTDIGSYPPHSVVASFSS
jgi:hypothetical protein